MSLLASILSGLARYAIKKGVQGLNRGLFTSEFEGKLTEAVTKWSRALPPEAALGHPNAILKPDSASPPSGEVAEKLSAGLVPLPDEWLLWLLQHWDYVRETQPEPQAFFCIEQSAAEEHLRDLAWALFRVCAEDAKHFNAHVVTELTSHTAQLAKLVQLVQRAADSATPAASDFHAKIELACKYTTDGQPDIAIAELTTIRSTAWDKLSPREQYRVVANLGIAYDAKNDCDVAARHYIECRQYLPDDEKARCWEAIGISHSDRATATARIEDILRDFPSSDLAWSLKVRHFPDDMSFQQIEREVPAHIREMPETQLALSIRAKQANSLAVAEEYARKLLKLEPSCIPVLLTLAEILLQQVRCYAVESGIDNPPINHPALKEVDIILAELSPRVPPTSRFSYSCLRFFQAVSCHLQGAFNLASKHFHAACEVCSNAQFVLQHAILLHDIGDVDAAIELLESGPINDSQRATLLLASMLLGRSKGDDLHRVLTILTNEVTKPFDDSDLALKCVELLAECMLRDKRPHDAIATVDQHQGLLSSSAYFALRAKHLRRAGRIDEAKAEISKADISACSRLVTLTIAEELLALELWDEAFTAWKGLATAIAAGDATRALLRAAFFAGEDDFVLTYCERLRENGIYQSDLFHFEVNKMIEYNAIDSATAAMASYVELAPASALAKELRVRLSNLALLSRSMEHLTFDRSLLPSPTDVDSDVGLCVTSVLIRGPNPMDAVDYAYKLLRANFDEADAHKAMIISIIKSPRASSLKLPESSMAAPGFAIKYQDDQTGEQSWHIIEDEDGPDASRDEYAVVHPISRAMEGKGIGDIFFIRNDSVQQKTGKIVDIWSKYKLRFNICMEDWETRFADDNSFLWKFTAPTDGAANQSALAPFEQRERFIDEFQEIYKATPISMVHFASRTGMNTAEAIWHLASAGLPIRCCTGQAYEANAGIAAVTTQRKVILDSSAISTLIVTGLATELAGDDVEFYVSYGTLIEMREMLAELKESSGNRLVKDGDSYRILTVSDEQRAADVERIQKCVDDIEAKCKPIEGRARARLSRERRKVLGDCLPVSVAETLAIAQEEGYVLWSDDQAVSVIGRTLMKVYDRIWTDALFHWQATQQHDGRCQHKASARLTQFNYHFTQLSPQGVLLVCQECSWNVQAADLSRVLAWFSIGELDSRTVISVTALTLFHLWTSAKDLAVAEEVVRRILSNIRARGDSMLIMAALPREIVRVCGMDILASRKLRQCVRECAFTDTRVAE